MFLHALFWVSGPIQEWSNQTTKQFTFTSGVQRTQWGPGGVQAKPYESINNGAPRWFLGIALLKVSAWIFLWHRYLQPIWQLCIQNIKYLMHLEKNMSLSKRFYLFFPWDIHENVGKSFFGCLHCSNGTKTWLDAALIAILEFDLNLHLILDVPRIFPSKCVATNHTSCVMVNIKYMS